MYVGEGRLSPVGVSCRLLPVLCHNFLWRALRFVGIQLRVKAFYYVVSAVWMFKPGTMEGSFFCPWGSFLFIVVDLSCEFYVYLAVNLSAQRRSLVQVFVFQVALTVVRR